MKQMTFLAALLLASTGALADQPEVYHYGQKLDIAKVISMENPKGCEVGEATMVYEDSKGQRHTLVYERIGEFCHG
ncbi:DUF2790 domain-containing protein [Stutzerimonas azotifigens]|uniref:DUF2790 domain-containing protein n=1 Tax=Stutzerimonas azotifigens TaxID=291995 RepID=UPI00040098E0|nr:DUF2790 domain-containing protein [Stutzerimonas azotifigens]